MQYIYLIIPFSALALTQLYKFITESIKQKNLRWDRLFNGYGGMPSSHTAFTFSLTGSILYTKEPSDPIFALSLIFSLITASDAIKLRGEVGKQAKTINEIEKDDELNESIGHTLTEVIIGAIVGLLYSYIMVNILIGGNL